MIDFRILGGRLTTDHNEMTHLVMTKPTRTLKFLYALCRSKYIILVRNNDIRIFHNSIKLFQSSWLEESAKLGCFQPEENHWVTDLGTSVKCNIPAVIKSPIRKTLFENRVFFITPSVVPGPS